MTAPDAIINQDKLYIQYSGAGVAMGRPDQTLAFYLDVGDQIHFMQHDQSAGTWTDGITEPYTWVPDKDQVGGGTIHYNGRNGNADVIIVKAKGILFSTMLGKQAATQKKDPAQTNFYASNVIIGGGGTPANVLNSRKVTPFATVAAGEKSAKTNGGSSGGTSAGSGSSSGGSSPRGTSQGTSQSTMYLIGGGALIALLFLFTQKK